MSDVVLRQVVVWRWFRCVRCRRRRGLGMGEWWWCRAGFVGFRAGFVVVSWWFRGGGFVLVSLGFEQDALWFRGGFVAVSYTRIRAHETKASIVCRLLLETNKKIKVTPSTSFHSSYGEHVAYTRKRLECS